MGTGNGTGNFSFFLVVSENLVPEKNLGTGMGKIWYRKKVSEPVSEKFGTGKSLGTGIGKVWYRKKGTGIGIENIWYRTKSIGIV